MVKEQNKSKYLFAILMVFCCVSCVFALNAWTDAYRYSLKAGDGWKTNTENGTLMGQDKDSLSKYFDVLTVAKTMDSKPKFRLVNSENSAITKEVTTAKVGQYTIGDSNTGQIGHAYYGSVKPAWNQLGTDSISLQMRIN